MTTTQATRQAVALSAPEAWHPERSNQATSTAPDGAWRIESISTTARLLVQVVRASDGFAWLVQDEEGVFPLGYPFPSHFHWSADGRYLYFYGAGSRNQYASGTNRFCNLSEVNIHPQRLNLETGELLTLTNHQGNELEEFSLSPRAANLAYFPSAQALDQLAVRDLDTGEEFTASFDAPGQSGWSVGPMVWSPDENALAFAIVESACTPASVHPTSVVVVDLPSRSARTVIADDRDLSWQFEWLDAQTLLLHSHRGSNYRFDVEQAAKIAEEQMPVLPSEQGRELGWLTFLAQPDGYPAVYAVRADGSDLTRLTDDLSPLFTDLRIDQIGFGGWSPTGTWFVFSGSLQNSQNDQDILIASSDGTARKNLTDSRAFEAQPDWSPDGRHIVILSQLPQGQNPLAPGLLPDPLANPSSDPLVATPIPLPTIFTDVSQPAWSPASDRIAFVAAKPDSSGCDLYTVSANGADLQFLASIASCAKDLAWSPDGTRIAFLAALEGDDEVYTIDSDGAGLTQVTRTRDETGYHENSGPVWSPDGAYIAYLSRRNERPAIMITRVDGSGEWTVVELPVWANSLSWGCLLNCPDT